MYDWKPVTFSDDTQTYYSASIEKNGSSHKIVYARQSEMGMTVAVTLTMKLIEHFRPQFMIMVGIAAGIARSDMAEQIYGDVVVADMIWNYTSGKPALLWASGLRSGRADRDGGISAGVYLPFGRGISGGQAGTYG